MDEAYAVFDTLSLDADIRLPEPAATPSTAARKPVVNEIAPVLARVPMVEDQPRWDDIPAAKPTIKPARIDLPGDNAAPHATPNLGAATGFAEGNVVSPTTTPATTTVHFGDELHSLRFDTVAARPVQEVADPVQETHEASPHTASESFADVLLRLESIIAPYSRWIALAAVIAAIGLTLVLLNGAAPPAILGDTPSTTSDQAQGPSEASIFADMKPLAPLKPSIFAANPTGTTATGPQSIPRVAKSEPTPRQPTGVMLTGEVFPKLNLGPLSPNALPQEGFPRTAAATAYPTTDTSTRR
ncbi:hypothetical protein [Botrimarina hoheduenensis]|uniref:Uncharacterized protein n=1 Tax=Botrimarina hoheduenensis TaxID=2528000 RepID=A0A5C5VXJ3_9BACT|nr:hypothetical protein [Botrimarina hoheduenensis]TWT43358.1 hypothetical protein Pla111_23090 [Botrimarina hoheduenensis]